MSFFKNKKEKFDSNDSKKTSISSVIWNIFRLLIVVLCVYLSWTCNYSKPVSEKIVRAFFAGIFNIFYLIYYVATQSDCYFYKQKMMSIPTTPSPSPSL